jgi:hypothetical protein
VHHHYDYKKDGHKRTYLMHIETGGEGEHWHGGMKTKVYESKEGVEGDWIRQGPLTLFCSGT